MWALALNSGGRRKDAVFAQRGVDILVGDGETGKEDMQVPLGTRF